MRTARHHIQAARWAVVALLPLAAPCLALDGPVVVRLAPVSTISGERVTLGEIAQVENAPPSVAGYLASLDLGNAPGPGKRQQLKSSHVQLRVRQQQLGIDNLVVSGPPILELRGEGSVVSGETLAATVLAHVRASTGWTEEDALIRVVRSPGNLHLPPGETELELMRISGDDYGLTLYVVTAWQNGFEVGRMPVSLDVRRSVPVLVANNTLARDAQIEADDLVFKLRTVRSAQDERRYLDDPSLVVGLRTRRVISESMPITLDMVTDPPMVRRGDQIRVQMRRDGLVVSTQGRAMEGGRLGDDVRIKTKGGALLMGKVETRDLVVVP